jgi:hypothetical protein
MDAGNDHLLDIDFANETADQAEPADAHDPSYRFYMQGMPINFIKSFCLEKVFLPSYKDVEFDLALAALDYLQDLECTRRDILRDVAKMLGITEHSWRDVLADNSNALSWVKNAQHWSIGLEICYAELYVGLRIWVRRVVFIPLTCLMANR